MLPTKEQIKEFEKMTGQAWDPRRRSGRSLAIALKTLGTALEMPGVWIQIRDHYATREADRYLAITVDNIVRQLNLQHIVFTGIHTLEPQVKFDWPPEKGE